MATSLPSDRPLDPASDPLSPSRALALGLAGIALVTLWRVALLPFDRADLYVDDAQYWLWGQELAFGYYSKPPLIGWILRLSTDIGSDDPFWIRLPLPLIHAATSVVLMLVGRRLFDARTGMLAGLIFVTAPAVAVASLLVSTDTPMLCCFAIALYCLSRLTEARSAGWALAMGAAIGLGLMAKYAMIYFPASAAIAAILLPRARIAWRDAGLAALVALAILAPNVWWNATNGLATLHHTADNSDFAEGAFFPGKLAGFLAGQFAISGPVAFGAFLAGLGWARRGGTPGFLALMALPTLVIVSIQALRAGAHTNWAAAGHVAAIVLAAAVLRDRRRWLILSFAIALAITLALPVAAIFAPTLRFGSGNLALARYVGQAELARKVADVAGEQGLDTLVADNRPLLASLFYTLRDSGLGIYSAPPEGFPDDHYAQKHPLLPGPGDVLYATFNRTGLACRAPGITPEVVASWTPTEGFTTNMVRIYRVPRACWFPAG